MIYAYKKESFLFDDEGSFLGYTESIVDENIQINGSCSTLLNGNTMILGGGTDNRQVCKTTSEYISFGYHRFRSFLSVVFRVSVNFHLISFLEPVELS